MACKIALLGADGVKGNVLLKFHIKLSDGDALTWTALTWTSSAFDILLAVSVALNTNWERRFFLSSEFVNLMNERK